MQPKKTHVILDVDAGIDDAVAIMLAVNSPSLSVDLISTCSGNVDANQVGENVLNILNLIKRPEIPVVIGETEPLKRPRMILSVHGTDGMGDFSEKFPKHNLKPVEGRACEKMAEMLLKSQDPMTIISVGPLTNLAKLVLEHPEVKPKIEKFVLCAGSIEKYAPGVLPYFGFNVMIDPEACEEVLKSGVPIEVCPTDMGHFAYLDYFEVYQTKNTNSMGQVLEMIYRKYRDRHIKNGIATHDSCAVAFVTNPEIFEKEKLHVHVGYYGENKTGVLRCEWEEPRNIVCATNIDIKKFKQLYFKALKRTKTLFD